MGTFGYIRVQIWCKCVYDWAYLGTFSCKYSTQKKKNMAIAYLKLDKRRALKDGTYPVKIAVRRTHLLIDTGYSFKEKEWNQVVGNTIRKREANLLATRLAQVVNTIMELRENGEYGKLTEAELRDRIINDRPSRHFAYFLDVCEAFLKTKDGVRTKELYRETMKKVEDFDDGVTLDEIKPNWLREFEVYLGGSVNGRAIHLRNIRAVFNYALDEELTQNYPFRKFKIRRQETRKRSLPVEDLRALIALDDLTKQEEEYRDMFMLIFYLIGINAVDLSRLTHKSVVHGRIEYRRAKTGKLYSIKIEPEAKAIIEKYKGKKKLLAPFERYANYRDYTHRLDDAMKKLGPACGKYRNGVLKREPINPSLSTYWARHSWATVAASLDLPNETIAAALGHSYGNKTTAIYINFDERKIDVANRAVIDHLNEKREP